MSVMDVAVQETAADRRAYTEHVNPQWARLLRLLEMDAEYVECRGETLRTSDGRLILDSLSGPYVYNAGHNHPTIVDALHHELDRFGSSMLQSHIASTAGNLAERQVLALVHSSTRFWQDALALTARAARI